MSYVDNKDNLSAKRNFYLMLSPADGQDIAVNAGLVAADVDVMHREEIDTLRRWTDINNSGVLDSLYLAASWMSDIMVCDSYLPEEDFDDDVLGDYTVIEGHNFDGSPRFKPADREDIEALQDSIADIKESAFNTVLGCVVSSLSKLIDEGLVTLNTVGASQ